MNNFKDYLENKRHVSANTVEAYLSDAQMAVDYFASQNILLSNCDTVLLRAYFRCLESEGKPNATIARTMTSLKSYFDSLIYSGRLRENPMSAIKRPKFTKGHYYPLKTNEIEYIIEYIGFNSRRDAAIISLLYSKQLELSAILALQLIDVNLEMNYIKTDLGIYQLKTNELEKYIIDERPKLARRHSNYVFLNNSGEKLSRQGFWGQLKHHAKSLNWGKEISIRSIKYSYKVNNSDLI